MTRHLRDTARLEEVSNSCHSAIISRMVLPCYRPSRTRGRLPSSSHCLPPVHSLESTKRLTVIPCELGLLYNFSQLTYVPRYPTTHSLSQCQDIGIPFALPPPELATGSQPPVYGKTYFPTFSHFDNPVSYFHHSCYYHNSRPATTLIPSISTRPHQSYTL